MHITINSIAYDTAASAPIRTRLEPAQRLGHCTLVALHHTAETGHYLHTITGPRRLISQPTGDCQQSITPLTDAAAAAWLSPVPQIIVAPIASAQASSAVDHAPPRKIRRVMLTDFAAPSVIQCERSASLL
jgi:hypothetical protein